MATEKEKLSKGTVMSENVTALDNKRRKLVDKYKNQNKVPVIISPMYRPYFGKNAMVSVNGIAVYVPCDGRPYTIPRSHAGVLFDKIQKIDENNMKLNKMSDVSANKEASVGSLIF